MLCRVKTCGFRIMRRIRPSRARLSTTSAQSNVKFDFGGQNALVSGAGGAIGRAISVALANSGANVYAVDNSEEGLKALSAEAPTAKTLVCDIGDSGVAGDIRGWAPNPTLAVHAAAIFRDSSFLDLTVESFDESMRANARGSFLFLQIAAQMMKEEGKGGSIVNLSTQGSKVGLRNHFAYCASKGALDQMTRVMAMELAEFGIRTNSVHPTVTKTSMGSYWTGDRKQNMIDRIPLGRFNEIDDIVWPVLYLLSDASTTVNGDTMMIDGGFFAAPWGQGQE